MFVSVVSNLQKLGSIMGGKNRNTAPFTQALRHRYMGWNVQCAHDICRLDSDEDIRLNENDCEGTEESGDVIDNVPVVPDIYVVRDDIEWIATRNVLRQRSGPTSFKKLDTNASFL
ncbi:hypothetical protein TNCV_4066761 [Trichonephila clavipes]|uniref:Uncharacterized protein n=1 Tax=Trichonephila clavipes TaxID=2585209 RepID=A0A8X6W9V6_TRICX|nr:hypothetical protein TNCV_4066761 [Trichonephila clavipes]